MNLRYKVLKMVTIILGALSIPLSTYVGFCFGVEEYCRGLVLLSLETALAIIDGCIYLWVLEHMR
jgi:hypothetical protein